MVEDVPIYLRYGPVFDAKHFCPNSSHLTSVEFHGVPKLGRDGLIDRPHDGIIPKRKPFRICAEADYVTGARRWMSGFWW